MRAPLPAIALLGLTVAAAAAHAQGIDRKAKVLNDRDQFAKSLDWVYNDLDAGIRAAKAAQKPLLVIYRCIPCEACQEFDDDVAHRDPIVRDVMDQFVCVRIPMANTIDLTHFQYDFDQSFAAFLMHPDMTIYGRFGTRSNRPESDDIALEGLRKAMTAALAMYKRHELIKPTLAGKQVTPGRFKVPNDYPNLAGKYQAKLDYEGKVVQSCMHCHQIRDAERQYFRAEDQPIPDVVLFPNPDPDVVGLTMDPSEMATIKAVAPGSSAARDGFRAGDRIQSLAGQPLLSIADLQWALHTAPAAGSLDAVIVRDGQTKPLKLTLDEGWRRRGNISWRTSSWKLRQLGLGGMLLEDLSDSDRAELKLDNQVMALKVKHVGEFGEHALAKKAGMRKDDLILKLDGMDRRMTESELLAYTMQRKHPGETMRLSIERDGKRQEIAITLPEAK